MANPDVTGALTADGPRRKVSLIVKLFVLFHVIAITIWAIPQPREAIREGRSLPGGTEWLCYWDDTYLRHFPPVELYDSVTGFWQYWDMFAPDPTHQDEWCDAEVVYRDGALRRYQYPRIFLLSIWQKFFNERYRKFYERAGLPRFSYLWPSFGMRVAVLNDNPKNPPVEVRLYRHTRMVVPPGSRQPAEYTVNLYFTYVVDQTELNRLRRIRV